MPGFLLCKEHKEQKRTKKDYLWQKYIQYRSR